MSKRLNIKYTDFINETLLIQNSLMQIINSLPQKGPIASLLYYLATNDGPYDTNSTINFISISDSPNMLKYPPKNKRIRDDLDDMDIFDITPQTQMRIGRVVRTILNAVDKNKVSAEYEGSATFDKQKITFNEKKNGRDFADFINGTDMGEITQLYSLQDDANINIVTRIKVFIDDIQVIESDITYYDDQSYMIEWDRNSESDYFKIILSKDTKLKGIKEVKIRFEDRFDGKSITEINDSDVEKFVNDMMAFLKMNMSPEGAVIEEVKGEDIRKWYDSKNYQSKSGQLGGSCMSYNYCQSYLDIYVENPEKISLLILKNSEDKLVGRALLWKLDNGKRFVDRIYTHTEYDVKIFEKWAIDNKCMYRSSGNNGKITYYSINGKKLVKTPELTTELENVEFENYPYVDTICYLNREESLISNEGQGDMELRDTEGRWMEYYDDENEGD